MPKPLKPKGYEDEPEPVPLQIGSHSPFTEVPKEDKPKKRQIGFIRKNEKANKDK